MANVAWSAKRYSSSRRLLNSHFGPQPALPNVARTLQTTMQTPQSQMPRPPPVPEFLYESQWPASAARSDRVAVVVVQHAAQALTAHTQAALSPRFASFQDSNPQSAAFSWSFLKRMFVQGYHSGSQFSNDSFLASKSLKLRVLT